MTDFREMTHHIWLVGGMRFASHDANLALDWGHLVYHIIFFFLPPSVKSIP